MNNKGFAITTLLYGTMVLFLLLLLSMLAMLSIYKERLEILIENTNGARDIINDMALGGGTDDFSLDVGMPIYMKIGDVVSFPLMINGSGLGISGIKTCRMKISSSNNNFALQNISGRNGFSVTNNGNIYTLSASNLIFNNSEILNITGIINGDDYVKFEEVQCSSNGSVYFDIDSIYKRVEVVN